jgi:hypothetical protein
LKDAINLLNTLKGVLDSIQSTVHVDLFMPNRLLVITLESILGQTVKACPKPSTEPAKKYSSNVVQSQEDKVLLGFTIRYFHHFTFEEYHDFIFVYIVSSCE